MSGTGDVQPFLPDPGEDHWTLGGGLAVGFNANGTLTLSGGGTVSNTAGEVGRHVGGVGVVTVTGAGSTWTNSGNLDVGVSGKGTLLIQNGGAVSNTSGSIGGSASGSEVTVTGAGSTWAYSGTLRVGTVGKGTLTISSGGAVSNTGYSTTHVGEYAGSQGEVTVTGAGSTWTLLSDPLVDNLLSVGTAGKGTLTISGGGAVSSPRSYLGNLAGGEGEATVTGAGSSWTVGGNGTLVVGFNGKGTLTVSNGGAVSNTGLGIVGSDESTATVTGAGSTWTAGSLHVGWFGAGALTVADGGLVSSASAEIGVTGTDNGSVTLQSGGILRTGYVTKGEGAATLTLMDGGILRATGDETDFLRNFAPGQVLLGGTGGYIDTQAFDIGIATALQGAGSLNKRGSGALTLSGANTYTGDTNIAAGTLKLGADEVLPATVVRLGNSANTSGTLDLNGHTETIGSLVLGTAIATTVPGLVNQVIDGAGGGLLKLGGPVTFNRGETPANERGGAVISAHLDLNHGANTSNRAFNVDDSANADVDLLVSGNISGTGGLTKDRAGVLELSGANSYTGSTLIQQGTIRAHTLADLGVASSLGASTVGGDINTIRVRLGAGDHTGTLEYVGAADSSTNRPYQIGDASSGSGGGAIVNNGTGTLTFTRATFNSTTTTTAQRTLTLGGSNTGANTIQGTIQNNNGGAIHLSKQGAGTWILEGANTYTGSTWVDGGTLLIEGSLLGAGGEVWVASGAALGGSGLIERDLWLENGARLLFDPLNTLTVTGQVSFLQPGFGVAALLGLGAHTPDGIYTLIAGTTTDFSSVGLENFGFENAYDLGDGKLAWFENGSLQLVVSSVPEPSTYALALGAGVVGLLALRRRRGK